MDFEYSKIETGIRIDRYAGTSKFIKVPTTIDGLPVTEIGTAAFKYCVNLTEIILPDTLQRIHIRAFLGCCNLTAITIPASVNFIALYAFCNCVKLEYVNLSSADIIKEGIFNGWWYSGCWSLKAFRGITDEQIATNPYLVEVLADAKSCKCHIMEKGAIKYAETESGIRVEKYYGSYETFNVPAELDNLPVTEIGKYAFRNEDAFFDNQGLFRLIKIPNSVKIIGTGAFEDCLHLETIELPKSLKEIGKAVFRNCVSLKAIRIPASVKIVDFWAFKNCKKLVTVELPVTTEINNNAFKDCREDLKIIRY